MIIPVIIPFNLLKASMNSALAVLCINGRFLIRVEMKPMLEETR